MFLLSFAAVGSGGVRARPKPAEFPLLRKVPLTSAVSEILRNFKSRQECAISLAESEGLWIAYRPLKG